MSCLDSLQISSAMLREAKVFAILIDAEIRGLGEVKEHTECIERGTEDCVFDNAIGGVGDKRETEREQLIPHILDFMTAMRRAEERVKRGRDREEGQRQRERQTDRQ
jgi:hypothetical protein